MNDDTVNCAVKKPTGPKPRRPLSSMSGEFRNRLSDTLQKKNSSKNGSVNHSLDNSLKDFDTKSNQNSPLASKESVRHRQNSPGSNLYPDLIRELQDNEFYRSTFTSEDSRSYYTSSSSNSSPQKNSPRKSAAYVRESSSWQNSDEQNQNDSSLTGFLIKLFIAVLAIAFCVYSSLSEENKTGEEGVYSNDLRKNVAELKESFPSQNQSIWASFVSGIDDVSTNRLKPAVFLLLAIDEETTNCLAKKVARIASSTLDSTGYALLTPDLLENNISMVYSKVEEELKRTKTVIISDLLNLQPKAVEAFHGICDPDNSLVETAVYLFIINSKLYDNIDEPTAFAERKLRESYSMVIREEVLDPLITRLTAGALLPIIAEKTLPCRN